jgi:hypothetical protein
MSNKQTNFAAWLVAILPLLVGAIPHWVSFFDKDKWSSEKMARRASSTRSFRILLVR